MAAKHRGGETVAELGEDAVLSAIVRLLPTPKGVVIGTGDDAAGLRAQGVVLLSTDTMVANRDFSLEWSSASELARKAVASNFADIAAMGVVPTGLLVALTVPPSATLTWLTDFAHGLALGIERLAPGAGVIGGDLALGSELHIAVTSVGLLTVGDAVKRSGARPGNSVAIAGRQGWSAAGLELLRRGSKVTSDEHASSAVRTAIAAHLAPEPPILLGEEARRAGATAMLDVSDGLVRDAGRIAKASGVAINFEAARLQLLVTPLLEVAHETEPNTTLAAELAMDWVLQGGEDHCLLATFPADVSPPDGFMQIGTVSEGSEGAVLLDGRPLEARGWDSVRSPSATVG